MALGRKISQLQNANTIIGSEQIPLVQNGITKKVTSSNFGGSGGVTNHSQLNLDDGTNPHGTTKADVGLGNVDNTTDLDKPISNATQSALNSISSWQTLYQDTDRNLTNTINVLQKAFSTTAFPNGAFSPPTTGIYEFEWDFAVQDLSAVSGILSVGFLGSATFLAKYHMTSQKTSFVSSSGPYNIYVESNGIVNTYTSTTSTQAYGFIKGIIEVTALGTIIPCFLINQSATPLVKKGMKFKIAKINSPISNFS